MARTCLVARLVMRWLRHWKALTDAKRERWATVIRWELSIWHIIDLRTLRLIAAAHGAVVFASNIVEVESTDSSVVARFIHHLLTQLLWCVGEFLFARRAVLGEIHSDLCGAAFFSLALAVGMCTEAAWGSTPVWAAVISSLLSSAFVALAGQLWSRLGWRRYMAHGSDKTRTGTKILGIFQSVMLLDLLFSLASSLMVAHIVAERSFADASAWQAYIGLPAAILSLSHYSLLVWAVVGERRDATLAIAVVGCVPVAILLLVAGHNFSWVDGLERTAVAPNASTTGSHGGGGDTALSTNSPRTVASYQLFVAVAAALVRVSLLALSARVSTRIFGSGLRLCWALGLQQHEMAAALPERWHGVRPELRASLEHLARGHELDVVMQAVVKRPTSPSPSSATTAPTAAPVEVLSSSRSFIQYSCELETLRWSWEGCVGLDQIHEVGLTTKAPLATHHCAHPNARADASTHACARAQVRLTSKADGRRVKSMLESIEEAAAAEAVSPSLPQPKRALAARRCSVGFAAQDARPPPTSQGGLVPRQCGRRL